MSSGRGMFNQFVSLIEKVDDQPAAAGTADDANDHSRSGSDEEASRSDAITGRGASTGDAPRTPQRTQPPAPRRQDGGYDVATTEGNVDGGDAPATARGDDGGGEDSEMPSPIPAETSLVPSDAGNLESRAAIARLSVRIAEMEIALATANRRTKAAEATAAELTQLIEAKDAALKRLLPALMDDGDDASPRTGEDVDEDAKYEAMAALGSADDGPTAVRLRHAVEHQSQAITELESTLRTARAQIVAVEALSAEVERRAEGALAEREEATAAAGKLQHELANSKKEVGRLSAKFEAMRATIDDLTGKLKASQREVDAAQAQILRRDNELVQLRVSGGGQSKELRQDPVIQAVAKNKWGNQAVSFATVVDVLVLRFGRLLRSNAMLRLITVLYIAVLHLYVFNAVMVFLHHSEKMPDHMGDDVHDHIANHVHH